MKKIRLPLLLVMLALPALCWAQSASISQGPSDITIVKIGWRVRTHRVELPAPPGANSAETNSGADPAKVPQSGNKGTMSGSLGGYGPVFKNEADGSDVVITLTNAGAKAIKRISYTFLFVDPTKNRTLLSYKFKNKVAIEPGETKTFVHPVGYAPAYQFDPRFAPGGALTRQAVDGIQITRVEYVDGSVWRSQ